MAESIPSPAQHPSDRVRVPVVRRLMHLYWRMQRGMTLGARVAAIDSENRIFLVKHTYVRGWHLPGGGVEPGETFLDAARRELLEEAHIEMIGAPVLHGIFFNKRVSRRDHVAVYVVREFRQNGSRPPDHEIAAAGFFPIADLPADVARSTAERIAEIVEGREPSPFW